jgi:peptide/nickel transport system substrate-binding protein
MKVHKLFVFFLVFAVLLSACAQTTPAPAPAAPAQPAATEAQTLPATEAPATVEAPAEAPAPAEDEKPLVIASPNDMTTMDPHEVTGMFPYRSVTYWMFDVLVTADRNGQPVPELATEWNRIDALTWEFKLAENATFHNGEPFNAEAVQLSFERMQMEELAPYNQIFRRTSLKEIVVLDDYTIQMITENPAPEFLYWLSESFIVPPQYYSENDLQFLAENPVGSGPYKLVEWVKDDHITFVANEDYFQGPPPIKDIVFRVIPEASSRMNELITGNVDLVTGLNPDQASRANSDVSRMISAQSWRKMHIGMAWEGAEELKDVKVRQALNYAVDKQAIIDSVLLGASAPLQSVVNPPLNNPALEPYPYDPEKAKAMLAEAGYPDGFTIKFQTPIERYGLDKDISQVVAQYLSDVGVMSELEVIEWGTYVDMLDAKSFAQEGLYFMGYSTYIVPGPQLGTLTCGALDNPAKYCNAEYDAMFEEFNTTDDDAARQDISNEMQALIWEDAPWIFLWRLPLFMGSSNRLIWEAHPALYVDAWEMSFQ